MLKLLAHCIAFFVLSAATRAGTVANSAASGPGSLRQAITDASPGDTISFAPELSGEKITLVGSQLTIDKDLTIDASALPAGLTIDADKQSRIFEVEPGNTVALSALTLTGGRASGAPPNHLGGAIYNNHAILTMAACTVFGNSAGSGGGIYSSGFNSGNASLSLTSCSVFDNFASSTGGGIFSNGEFEGSAILNLRNCTIVGNSAQSMAGAICNQGSYSGSASLNLASCTVSGNSADFTIGGIFNVAISGSADLTITDTIVAANSVRIEQVTPDILNDSGTVSALGVNLLGELDGSGLADDDNVDIGDPKLSPLGDYGGPTPTMILLFGSPAINAAGIIDPGGTDQRGLTRFVGDAMDIGATEYQPDNDLALLWSTDFDRDGSQYGAELALGTDPAVSDPGNSRNLSLPAFEPNGDVTLSFGRGSSAPVGTVWKLMRSATLLPGSFVEVFRFDGTTESFGEKTSGTTSSNQFIITDMNPPDDKAFYLFEAEQTP